MFYAFYCPYGTSVALSECHVPIVKKFATKAERDKWVNDDEFTDGNFHRKAATYKDAKHWLKDQQRSNYVLR